MRALILFLLAACSTQAGWYPPVGLQGGNLGKMTGDLTMQAQKDVRLADSDSSNYVAMQSPATIATNFTWTLPSAACASGQVLSFSDASGTMACADPTSGGGSFYGQCTTAAATSCQWQRGNASYGDFPADTDCSAPTCTGNASAPSTKIPGVSGTFPAGDYYITLAGEFSGNATSMVIECIASINSIQSTVFPYILRGVATDNEDNKSWLAFNLNLPTQQTGELTVQCKTNTGTVTLAANNAGMTMAIYKYSASVIESDIANTAYTPSTQGFGTISAQTCWYAYDAGTKLLKVNCLFTTGTTTASEARVDLPAGYTISNSSSKLGAYNICGLARSWSAAANDVWQFPILQRNVSYINFAYMNSGSATIALRNGNDIVGNSTVFNFECTVPID